MRRILHIDMDAFFAAVEEKRHPELIGKPVVIGGMGDPRRRGVVSTASYEARKFGIHSAMPLRTAYKHCPDAIFLPVDYAEYSRVSAIIKSILREFTDLLEDVGIDEAFLDISHINKSPEEIGHEIKERIRNKTGLSCSIGIAPNKLLAKIASDLQKPNGLALFTESNTHDRLWPLPVRKLWGLGPKTEARLKQLQIDTIGKLATMPLDTLVQHFGKSYGAYLYQASKGIDESPLVTHWEPKSASRETTFQTDVGNWQTLAKNLVELVKQVVSDIREKGYKGKTVTVKIRFDDFTTFTRAKTIAQASDSYDEIRKAAFECFNRIALKKKVRLIGIRMSNLQKA
jgi:DNA polymerase-4